MEANRRRRSRVDMNIPATFTTDAGPAVQILVCNISLKGLLAVPEESIQPGAKGVVRITLAQDAVITVECQVIRSDKSGVAIDFMPMDEDSFFHLRNLVRYNAADADQIDDELKRPAFD